MLKLVMVCLYVVQKLANDLDPGSNGERRTRSHRYVIDYPVSK